MYKTEGYRITKSNYSTFRDWVSTSSNDVIKNTHVGDIYRVGEDYDGYITFKNKYRLYPADEGYINTGPSERNSLWRQAEFCAIYGSVIKSSSDDGITIIPKKVLSNTDISAETQYDKNI